MELKQKGESAAIGAFNQLKVSLIWTSAVDLDLMAFYKTKDGRTEGVYSDNYSGGNMGTLNSFPFMQLSGDAGVGATGGDNCEEMQISKLDDIEELHVVAVNFTDASSGGANKVFADYDARVEVQTDRGENHVIKLDSHNPGSVAVLCKFTSSFMGAQLANDSSVMNFDSFKSTVPGASSLKLMSKVTLKGKGDAQTIQLKQKGDGDSILINLNWKTSVDLDLGCFYELQGGTEKYCIDGLQFSRNRGGPRDRVTRQGCFTQKPWIWHQGDDRTGAESAGEFIHINSQGYGDIKRVDIYAMIYEGVARWNQTDAVMTLKVPGSPDIIVEMGKQTSSAMYCLIANLEFLRGDQIRVTKQVTFHDRARDCDRAYNWGLKWQAGKK